MLQRISFFILLFITFAQVHGQDMAWIKGALADSSGKPLELVNVIVKEDQKYVTMTDGKGAYEMKVPAGRKITIVFTYLNKTLYSKAVELKKMKSGRSPFR